MSVSPLCSMSTPEELEKRVIQLEKLIAELSTAKEAATVAANPRSKSIVAKDKAKEKASQEKDDALQKEMTALAHSMQDVKEATQKEIIPNEKPFVAGTNGEALDTTIQLPFESIYGIACLGPTQSEPSDFQPIIAALSCGGAKDGLVEAMFKFWIMIVQNYFLLVVNYLVQWLFMGILRTSGINNINNNTCNFSGFCKEFCQSQYYARLCCMCLFLSTVFGDISETLKLAEWHWMIKTESTMKAMEVKNPGTDDAELVTGLTCSHKFFNLIFIIIPKLTIGLCVFYYGGIFIAQSASDEDAFLNTLAAYFILEIDELLFSQFASAIMVEASTKIPPLKKKMSDATGMCSLLCYNILLMVFIFICYTAINTTSCFNFDIVPAPTSNATCNVNGNVSSLSWVNSAADGCALMNEFNCQQQFVGMMVKTPVDFPLITGCGIDCENTLKAVALAGSLDGLNVAAMILEIFGCLFVCCMILASIGDKEFAIIGFCTMLCFTVADVVLHILSTTTASDVSIRFHEIQNSNCLDLTSKNGNDRNLILTDIIVAADLSYTLGIVILICAGIEIFAGMGMTLADSPELFGLVVLCCQFLVSILTWVAYGAGSQIAWMGAESLLYNSATEHTTEGWCTGMNNITALCVSETRGFEYMTPSASLTFFNNVSNAVLNAGQGSLND